MANYQDAGHRPHARHTGEEPQNHIVEAPYHLLVTLDTWGPVENLFRAIYDALQANWGDNPSRTAEALDTCDGSCSSRADHENGWCALTGEQRAYVESCFAGKTLQQVLERITFSFCIDGCTRAATHQIVRTRLGAGFMQHGGRDNDWRHRPWVMPETIRRACAADRDKQFSDLTHCISNWEPIFGYMSGPPADDGIGHLDEAISTYLEEGRRLYSALVDAGIPWEDARRLLWIGTATYIHADYNYVALKGMLANRLEHVMDWEINCIAQLMLREVKIKCPPLLSKYLGSASDLAGQAKFAGLESWPPDGKYPSPYERCEECGHTPANHHKIGHDATFYTCEVCDREKGFAQGKGHPLNIVDSLIRAHRPEQNPFWVLHPDSMNGGPIKWIPTNGTYPHEEVRNAQREHAGR